MKSKTWFGVASVATSMLIGVSARAEESAGCATVTRESVVRCAVAASLSTRAESLGLESLEGRRRAASVILPSNPTVNVSGGYPIEPGLTERPVLWGASLSQELELGGQRGARVDVVSAEQRAQRARLAIARRDAAADALLLYFDVLAANEEAKIAERLAALSAALSAATQARAQSGVSAGVEAQLATATSTRLQQAQLGAQQRVTTTLAALASALGLDPTTGKPRVDGDLSPLSLPDAADAALIESAIARRPEVNVSTAESEAQQKRVSLYRRQRIPNVTLSFFARNDWIGERAAGVGLGIPIPFPAPLGRSYGGEIAEATALSLRADTEAERVRRAVRLEVTRALQVLEARRKQAELYRPEQIRDNNDMLRNIAQEIEAGRMPIKDAILTQQSLVDYLFGYVEARRQLCFASVELARVTGMPLDRGAQ